MKKTAVTATVLVLAGTGLYLGFLAGEDAGRSAGSAAGPDGPTRLDEAPVVEFETPGGDRASLADYEGQVILLNFWGTWCPPCRREIPDLVEVQKELGGQNATVIGLAVASGSPSDVMDFAREFEINYPIWLSGTGKVVEHYRVMGFPTTLLIDREGKVRKRYMGPQTAERLLADLRPLL